MSEPVLSEVSNQEINRYWERNPTLTRVDIGNTVMVTSELIEYGNRYILPKFQTLIMTDIYKRNGRMVVMIETHDKHYGQGAMPIKLISRCRQAYLSRLEGKD